MPDRREFVMSEEQHKRLLDACRPVRLIMLQCGMPASPQENANAAWRSLGQEIGFLWDTVEPVTGKDSRHFTAEPIINDQSDLCDECGFMKTANHEHTCGRQA